MGGKDQNLLSKALKVVFGPNLPLGDWKCDV